MTLPEEPVAAAAQLRRRKITVAVIAGGVSVLVVALIIALMATNSDDSKSVSAASISAASTTNAPAGTPATTPPTQPPAATDAPSSVPSTIDSADTDAPDTGVAATATPPSSISIDTVASATTAAHPPASTTTPTSSPVKPVAVANCSDVGAINIPATGVNSTILAERKAYSDGLLCGNHTADHIAPGVDILPGFASLSDSVTGGAALQGQVPAIIFGHRNSHNRPFLNNNKLHPGDAVVITDADGTTLKLTVDSVQLLSLKAATTMLLTPSADGKPQIRLVCCSHADGSPGGVNYRWIVTVSEA